MAVQHWTNSFATQNTQFTINAGELDHEQWRGKRDTLKHRQISMSFVTYQLQFVLDNFTALPTMNHQFQEAFTERCRL
jgi:hypothetical protein